MEPKLDETYGNKGPWNEIVAAQMGFPADLPKKIRGLWERYLVAATAGAAGVDPEEFAREFIDQNFPDIAVQ